ncbi:MAG: terpene cyclase/mutase family protein [Acidobacteria bacterium]|nr:terpene cyclase/mutase family protein [Acidobacteriota bacterium]
MADWFRRLKYNSLSTLLSSPNRAIAYFARRDLLNEKVGPINAVWELTEPQKILRKQQPDGSWIKSAKDPDIYPPNHYSLVETFKNFRILVERYGFTKNHPSIPKAAGFLFAFQTPKGDIRGFIGNQYAPYYTGYVISLLIQAGYEGDPHIEKAFQWLLSMRQNDGGWTVPLLTHSLDRKTWIKLTSTFMEPLEPDRSQPFSHMATDMVLRSFAAHSKYRRSDEAKAAGALLKSRFFHRDAYTSYQSPKYWTRFAFWWPNLLTSLNSLSILGFSNDDPDIMKGLNWFLENQEKDGLWKLESTKPANPRDYEARLWLSLNIFRLMKKVFPSAII